MTSTGSLNSRGILVAVATALFCVQIDYFAMNLALPTIASEFGVTPVDLRCCCPPVR